MEIRQQFDVTILKSNIYMENEEKVFFWGGGGNVKLSGYRPATHLHSTGGR